MTLDLSGNGLILMWPLVTLLAWMLIVRGLVHLLTKRSWNARWGFQPARMRSSIRCGPGSFRGPITVLATAVAVLTVLTTGVGMYVMNQVGTTPRRDDPHPAVLAADGVHLETASDRSPASTVVNAGERSGGSIASDYLCLIGAIEAVELIALAAWGTWWVTGRLARPVDTVRAELAQISFSDLPTRISEPGNALEVARLCRTINDLLRRVYEAKKELQEVARRHRQFAADVSHELRTPITGLRTQLEEAQQDPGRVRLPDLLKTTLDQVERLQTITDDMLFLACVRECPPAARQQLDLAALVRNEISQREDQRPVRLRLTHGSTVTAVPTQISRILANLLDNSQRHSKHLVCVEVRATNAAVELVVSDDGSGIAIADRERVFHRFTRLDDARRLDGNGTGLGLAIARDIAHAHHGTLSVEESAAGGARFVLRLPRVRPREMETT